MAKESTNYNHIVIHGYYGAGNYGDDIILLSIIESLRGIVPGLKITVLSRDVYPVSTGSYKFEIISRYNFNKILSLINKADLLICGGGGIFQDYSGFDLNDHFGERIKGLNYYTVPVEIACLLGKPVMLYAIGAGPFFQQISRRYIKTILSMVDIITVRTPDSRDILKNILPTCEPIVTADPAVNYLKNTPYPVNNNSKYAGICLRNWFFQKDQRKNFITEIAKIADSLHKDYNYTVILFPFNKNKSDLTLLESIYEQINYQDGIQIFGAPTPEQSIELIQSLDFLFGMRLHSLIIATACSIPVIAISYDNKVKNYLNLLDLANYSLPVENINLNTFDNKFSNLLNKKREIKTQLNKNFSLLKEREKENARLAINLLGGNSND